MFVSPSLRGRDIHWKRDNVVNHLSDFLRLWRSRPERKTSRSACREKREFFMLALAVVVISGVFVLTAMAGLADALVCLACWVASQLIGESKRQKTEQTPAQGITA
jgi:hypothetical protein